MTLGISLKLFGPVFPHLRNGGTVIALVVVRADRGDGYSALEASVGLGQGREGAGIAIT